MKLLALTLMTLFCAGLTSVTAQNTGVNITTTAAAAAATGGGATTKAATTGGTTTVAPASTGTTTVAPATTGTTTVAPATTGTTTVAPTTTSTTTVAPTTTRSSTLSTPSSTSPAVSREEQFRSCCVAAGVNSYCYKLCSYGGEGLLNNSDVLYLTMCSLSANRIAFCATRGRDESLCCASNGVRGLCLGICSGNPANYPSQVLACAPYYKAYALCYNFFQSMTTAATPAERTTVAPTGLVARIEKLEAQNKVIKSRIEELTSADYVRRCRVCFKEVEGSSQCHGIRRSCSEYSDTKNGRWTDPFRDDTDLKPGGCVYQWRVQCQ